MRFNAVVTAAILPAVFFSAGGIKPAHADTTNNQTPTAVVAEAEKPVEKPPEPKIVTVQPGDYLAKIADANQTTYTRLFDANPVVTNPDIIYPGQQLRVPNPSEALASRSLPASAPAAPATPVAKAAPKAQPKATVAPAPVSSGDTSVWDRLAQCESGGNWSINTGNGFYGGLQFTLGSWKGVGGTGYPNQASKSEQIARAQILQSRQGWGAWPACTTKLGIR